MISAAWIAALVPALLAAAAIAILRRSPLAARLSDLPNERSLHETPTPRLGGLGIALAVLPFAILHAQGTPAMLLACALALAGVSLADDLRGLPPSLRLVAHLLAAVAAWIAIAAPPASMPGTAWLAGLALVLAIAWSTNLYNFMDGADGLAGAMAAVGFGAYAAAAWMAGDAPLALLCLALASASLGFLAWNFPPARVFLGDAGSIPLGFLAGALGAYGIQRDLWPLPFPFMAFSPFLVDATVTLLRRLAAREKVWRAHRGHYYQRLVLAGWSRRRLALTAGALMLASAASALVLARQGLMLQCGIISVWSAFYAVVLVTIDRTTRKMAATAR
jgi:UDP-N-acetylmuramyl pentapeptide phosphotransferase/UDP-N-acetylglucosamine-1-phosphate transferase